MNLALLLTYLRIAMIPLFVWCFYRPTLWGYLGAIGIFIMAAFTDWLDGYLARSLRQASKFGAFLDPVADKLLVISALVLIISESSLPYIAIPVVIIACREIGVSALREWMATVGQAELVAVSYGGKLKTTLQMIAIIVLLISRDNYLDYLWIQVLGYFILNIAALLSISTILQYTRAALKHYHS